MQNLTNASIAPAVGVPATISYWSDSYAATITAVSRTGAKLTLRELNAVIVSGSVADGSAEYRYESYPEGFGRTWTATRRPNGQYRLQGFSQGGLVSIGRGRTRVDPSF
jgi:hypothetical protein